MLLMRPYFHADLAIRTLLAGSSQPLQDASTLHDVKQHADGVNSNICETVIRTNTNTSGNPALNPIRRSRWWSLTGSNRRPPECKSGALPAELRPRLERRTGEARKCDRTPATFGGARAGPAARGCGAARERHDGGPGRT